MESNSYTDRVIVLLDMDCFYVQCEQRLQPDKWEKPCAVVQYTWNEQTGTGGGVIAVNYEARPYGVKRGMRVPEVLKLCPDCHIFRVPELNCKADLTRYRVASDEVFATIAEFIAQEEEDYDKNMIILERASVDEAYLDFTRLINSKLLTVPNQDGLNQYNTKLEMNDLSLLSWLENEKYLSNDDIKLTMGALFVGKLRKMIFEKTKFRCSAGISHNKMLAKLACSINKPNAQTILPFNGVLNFFKNVKIPQVRHLGGKFGKQVMELFDVTNMYELSKYQQESMIAAFQDKETARWVYSLAHGVDFEKVIDRRLSKSIACAKNFPGKNKLSKYEEIFHWIKVLCQEVHTRLVNDQTTNKRLAKLIIVGYYTEKSHSTKSIAMETIGGRYPEAEKLAKDIMKTVFPTLTSSNTFGPVLNLSIAATKFVPESNLSNAKIPEFFSKINRDTFIEKNEEAHEANDKSKSLTKVELKIDHYFKTMSQEDANNPVNEHIINIVDIDNEVEEGMLEYDLIVKDSFFFQKLEELDIDYDNFIESEDENDLKD